MSAQPLARNPLEARGLLVSMLQMASQLELTLMVSYLNAAASLKSTPAEFEFVDRADGTGRVVNPRRAIHFERVRAWKSAILGVAVEEMVHLHYVQCLLRALGERPYLTLPPRDNLPGSGGWRIANWDPLQPTPTGDNTTGTRVPLKPATLPLLYTFVEFESTASLQLTGLPDAAGGGSNVRALFQKMADLELDLSIQRMVRQLDDVHVQQRLRNAIRHVYKTHGSVSHNVVMAKSLTTAPFGGPEPPRSAFQIPFPSIAAWYQDGILPLYEQAFAHGWVMHNNVDLNDEVTNTQSGPNMPSEGFLPVGPYPRTHRFQNFSRRGVSSPLAHYKNVKHIVQEIVEEGEGFAQFERRANEAAALVASNGGVEGFWATLATNNPANLGGSGPQLPPWMQVVQLVRGAHLYKFGVISAQWEEEKALAKSAGVCFHPARESVSPLPPAISSPVRSHAVGSGASTLPPVVATLAAEFPGQFNAAYLCMIAWLSRIYERRTWVVDTPRRTSIEMVATWPLMSLAIRPGLELASLLGCDTTEMFAITPGAAVLPWLPLQARQLLELWNSPQERTQQANAEMDAYALRALGGVARWASAARDIVREAPGLSPGMRSMLLARLLSLSILGEFEGQFAFRMAGGYSSTLPLSPSFVNNAAIQKSLRRFEEDATIMKSAQFTGVFAEATLVLRVRFCGWALVLLATDPDPPTDEVGASGTLMWRATDGDGQTRRFNRAIVWQPLHADSAVKVERQHTRQPLGVNVVDVTLMATSPTKPAVAGLLPMGVMNTTGSVQANGVQQMLNICGLNRIASVPGSAVPLCMNLAPKPGVGGELEYPSFTGWNHLVWQDGEPIDPFVLQLCAGGKPSSESVLLQREIYNENHTLLQMTPAQRAASARGPCGFEVLSKNKPGIPAWAQDGYDTTKHLPSNPNQYLLDRVKSLGAAAVAMLPPGDDKPNVNDQRWVDEFTSLVKRTESVTEPLDRMNNKNWCGVGLHYGHTVSGHAKVTTSSNPLLAAFASEGLNLVPILPEERMLHPNSRWLLRYTQASMDTDALANFVYGDVYIPVKLGPTGSMPPPITVPTTWTYAAAHFEALAELCTNFTVPFWTKKYEIFDGGRKRRLSYNGQQLYIAEELVNSTIEPAKCEYSYIGEPLTHGIDNYRGSFVVAKTATASTLTWTYSGAPRSADAAEVFLCTCAEAAQAMTEALNAYFSFTQLGE